MKTIRIAIADDENLFRKAMILLLDQDMGVNVVFEAADGQELLDKLKNPRMRPDIVLMDMVMPGINGVEATRLVHEKYPEIRIIALSSHSTPAFIGNMIHFGAASYLVKSNTPLEVLKTINEVYEKGFYYDRKVLEVLKNNVFSEKKHKLAPSDSPLTARELEVLKLICLQKNTREIAAELYVSQRTVEGHRNNLLLKTQSRNIAGLVIFAIRNELIEF